MKYRQQGGDKMKYIEEFLEASKRANVYSQKLNENISKKYIEEIIRKFNPIKLLSHISIGHNSESVGLEQWEFNYSEELEDEPVYVFFEQSYSNKNKLILIQDGRELCRIFEHAYGMEYFVTNKEKSYLLAVNWYVIEGAGTAIDLINRLKSKTA
jgi:hypothetical protein